MSGGVDVAVSIGVQKGLELYGVDKIAVLDESKKWVSHKNKIRLGA